MVFTSHSLDHQHRGTKASNHVGSRIPKFGCNPAQCFSNDFDYHRV